MEHVERGLAMAEQSVVTMCAKLLPALTVEANSAIFSLGGAASTSKEKEKGGAEPQQDEQEELVQRVGATHMAVYQQLRSTVAAACLLGHRTCHVLWGLEGCGKSRILRLIAKEAREGTIARGLLVFELDGKVLRSEDAALRIMADQLLAFLQSEASEKVREADWALRTGAFDFGRLYHFEEHLRDTSGAAGAPLDGRKRSRASDSGSAASRPPRHVARQEQDAVEEEEEEDPDIMSGSLFASASEHSATASNALAYLHAVLLQLRSHSVHILLCMKRVDLLATWCDQLLYVLSGLLHAGCEGSGGGFSLLTTSASPDVRSLEKRLSSRLTPETCYVPLLQASPTRLLTSLISVMRQLHSTCGEVVKLVTSSAGSKATAAQAKKALKERNAQWTAIRKSLVSLGCYSQALGHSCELLPQRGGRAPGAAPPSEFDKWMDAVVVLLCDAVLAELNPSPSSSSKTSNGSGKKKGSARKEEASDVAHGGADDETLHRQLIALSQTTHELDWMITPAVRTVSTLLIGLASGRLNLLSRSSRLQVKKAAQKLPSPPDMTAPRTAALTAAAAAASGSLLPVSTLLEAFVARAHLPTHWTPACPRRLLQWSEEETAEAAAMPSSTTTAEDGQQSLPHLLLHGFLHDSGWVRLGYGSREVMLIFAVLTLHFAGACNAVHYLDAVQEAVNAMVEQPVSRVAFSAALCQLIKWGWVGMVGEDGVRLLGGVRLRAAVVELLQQRAEMCEEMGLSVREVLHLRTLI